MPKTAINLTGRTFGFLAVLRRSARKITGAILWECSCACGVVKEIRGSNLTASRYSVKSCGCKTRDMVRVARQTHGQTKTPEYKAYTSARQRCTNRKCWQWKNYGGRGIEFRFSNFEQFIADVGPRPSAAHSLDREKNSEHYAPGNVRWSTLSSQQKNRRRMQALENFTDAELTTELNRRASQSKRDIGTAFVKIQAAAELNVNAGENSDVPDTDGPMNFTEPLFQCASGLHTNS